MNAQTLLIIIIVTLCFNEVLSKVLLFLNLRYSPAQLPEELGGLYDDEEYRKSMTSENSTDFLYNI